MTGDEPSYEVLAQAAFFSSPTSILVVVLTKVILRLLFNYLLFFSNAVDDESTAFSSAGTVRLYYSYI